MKKNLNETKLRGNDSTINREQIAARQLLPVFIKVTGRIAELSMIWKRNKTIRPKEEPFMKKIYCHIILFISILFLNSGCSDQNKNPLITIEYLKDNAKIGMTENEIKNKFGQEAFRGYGDGSDVWIFDKTKESFKYTPDIQRVAHGEIKNGNLQYQLYINVIKNKTIMFSYFYKGDNGEIWQIVITPDGIQKETQVSHSN
ncbi:hypothetical protein ASL11_02285 [Paenibacillus sp. Soil750]|nr:hypothetical protein ASL11_02285 [Paenibacillus sp. Soil750]